MVAMHDLDRCEVFRLQCSNGILSLVDNFFGWVRTVGIVYARVYNEERVSNAPLPYRKHSQESNMTCT